VIIVEGGGEQVVAVVSMKLKLPMERRGVSDDEWLQ